MAGRTRVRRDALLVQVLRRRKPAFRPALLLPALPHEGRQDQPAELVPREERTRTGRHPAAVLPHAVRNLRRHDQHGLHERGEGADGAHGQRRGETRGSGARPRLDRHDGPFRLLGVLLLLGALRAVADAGRRLPSAAQQGDGGTLPAAAQLRKFDDRLDEGEPAFLPAQPDRRHRRQEPRDGAYRRPESPAAARQPLVPLPQSGYDLLRRRRETGPALQPPGLLREDEPPAAGTLRNVLRTDL